MKTLLSFIFIFFVGVSFSQDVKLIELEVNKLYEQYSKKRNHVIKTRLELDTLAFCQLRFLETLTDVNDITHQNPDPKFKTFNMRVNNYFINLMGEYFAEVISGSYKGSGNYIDEKSVAKVLFNALLGSPAHKKILDSRKFINYTFKSSRLENGSFILIGVFSSNEIFFWR
jgi:hypothetical protein